MHRTVLPCLKMRLSSPIFSDVREVPDNQEVFSYPTSDISIIVEVLERVDPTDPYDAIRSKYPVFTKGSSRLPTHSDSISMLWRLITVLSRPPLIV
jgi:hypothetical protein